MTRFLREWGWLILGVGAVLGLGVFVTVALQSSYNDFMADCVQYHAVYECRTLYRSG